MIKIINIENAAKEDILTRDIKLESGVEAIVADISGIELGGSLRVRDLALPEGVTAKTNGDVIRRCG